MNHISIKDMHGNEIEVTNIELAMKEAESLRESPFKSAPFTLKGGHSTPIKGREEERYTVGEYNADLLDKLICLKEGYTVESIVTTNAHGYKDYDILNHTLFHRAKVVPDIKVGDVFNAYYGHSSKRGVVWQGGLIKSLVMSGINEIEYKVKTHIDKHPVFHRFIGKERLNEALKDFEEQGIIAKVDESDISEIYDLELMREGAPTLNLKAKNNLSEKDTLINSIVWPAGGVEFFESYQNAEIENIILALINKGETYKDNFIEGYSFELNGYSA